MASRFEKFSERARRVLSLAQEEAQRVNHNYIGTEHILLGLVRENEGTAAKVLGGLSIELNKIRSAVEFIIGKGDTAASGEIGLTPRAKKVIELAVDEARRLNHHYIGTEHLLIGLMREGEGVAAGVLESLGVTLDKVRGETNSVLNKGARSSKGRSGGKTTTKTPTLDDGSSTTIYILCLLKMQAMADCISKPLCFLCLLFFLRNVTLFIKGGRRILLVIGNYSFV